MTAIKDPNFAKLLSAVTEVSQLYGDAVYIGSIAVYLHAINKEEASAYAEATSDADLYISVSDLSDLRDVEELTQNSKLSKHEFKKDGFLIDVYTERQSSLPIDYDFVKARAVAFGDVRVAALEELLVLKLETAVDRHASAHGKKDAKDVIRILLLASKDEKFDANRATAFMSQDHFSCLKKIMQGPEFNALAMGNSRLAKQLTVDCGKSFEGIQEAFNKPLA